MSSLPAWPCPIHSNVLYHPPSINPYIISCNTNFAGSDLPFLHLETLLDCLKACDNYTQDSTVANGAACVGVTFAGPEHIQNNCYLKYAASSASSVDASSNLQSARRQGYQIGGASVIDIGQLGGGEDNISSTITATNSADNNKPPIATPTPTPIISSQASSAAVIPPSSKPQATQATSSTTIIVYQSAPSASVTFPVGTSSRPAVAYAMSDTLTTHPRSSASQTTSSITQTRTPTSQIVPPFSTSLLIASTSSPASSSTITLQPQQTSHKASGSSSTLKLALAISLSSLFALILLFTALLVFFRRRRRRRRRRVSAPKLLPSETLPALYPIPPPVPPPKTSPVKTRSRFELDTPFSAADAELSATPIEPVPHSSWSNWKRPRTLAHAELEADGALEARALAELPGWVDTMPMPKDTAESGERHGEDIGWGPGSETGTTVVGVSSPEQNFQPRLSYGRK